MAITTAAMSNSTPISERRIVDQNFSKTANLPNGGSANNTSWIIFPSQPYAVTERIWVNVSAASMNFTNSSNINFVLQTAPVFANGSVDTGNLSNVITNDGLSIKWSAGNVTTPANAFYDNIMLPPAVKQAMRLRCDAETNVGTQVGGTFTIQLYF